MGVHRAKFKALESLSFEILERNIAVKGEIYLPVIEIINVVRRCA